MTHIKEKRQVGKYILYVGKLKGYNVVSDGKYYAYCENFRDGIANLLYKSVADRGAGQYKDLTLDSRLKTEEAITMYRVITGVCRTSTPNFIESLDYLKDSYMVHEIIELTEGQYGAKAFKSFLSSIG